MKRVAFFLFLNMLAILQTWGQVSYQSVGFQSVLAGPIDKTIVRELHAPTSISYVEMQGGHFFVYHDGDTNNLYALKIGDELYVNDFVIENDTVFFCGRNSSSSIGIIGHFKISDFFFNSGSYTTTDYSFYSVSEPVGTFDKMCTYTIYNERRLALIGQLPSGTYVVAEVQYDPLTTAWNYSIGELPTSYGESLLAITATDNYVITAGFYAQGNYVFPCMRIYDMQSLFMSNGPQDTKYYDYSFFLDDQRFEDGQIVLSHALGDNFTVATFWHGIGIGTYMGLHTISNNTVSLSGNIFTTQMLIAGGWKLRGMTPANTAGDFYLLQNADYPGETQLVDLIFEVNISDFISLGQLPMRLRPDPFLQSIDSRGNGVGFVSNGYYITQQNMLGFYNSFTQTPLFCFSPLNVSYSNTQMTCLTSVAPFSLAATQVMNSFQTYVGQFVDWQIELGCID